MDHSQSTTQSLQLLLILIFRVNFLARWHTLPPFQIIIFFIFSRCIDFATHLIFRFVAKSIHLDEKKKKLIILTEGVNIEMYIEMESLERRCEATTTSMCPSNNTTPPTYCIGLDGYYILAGAWSFLAVLSSVGHPSC